MSAFWTFAMPVLVAYPVVSYIFFKFPNLLHKRKVFKSKLINDALEHKGCMHIAHRGGSREHLENTMIAFKHGLATGTNSLEMDVHLTKDGKVIVCHDDELDRLCGINKSVSEYNYDEIPPFQEQVPLHFSTNMAYDSTKENPKDRRMPLLEEVFEAFPQTFINFELKSPNEQLIERCNELIKKYDREHLTIWGCRHKKFTQQLHKINPTIPTFFPAERVMLTYFAYFIGILPFISIPESSIQIPMLTKEYEEAAQVAKFPRSLYFTMTKWFFKSSGPLIQHLEKRGILVIFWVLNCEQDWEKVVNKGAHGIMTDTPTTLTEYLKRTNVYMDSHTKK